LARKGHGRPVNLVDIGTYPDDGSSPCGSNEWNANRGTVGVMGFTKKTEAISSNNINITDSYVEVTNAGTIYTMAQVTTALSGTYYPSDTSTKSFAEGDLLYLVKETAGHTVTLKHQNGGAGAGKITTLSGGDLLLDVNVPRIFICRTIGANQEWIEYGGAPATTPTDITVADSTDTTCFPALFESATGDLAPKTDAGLTYNAGTGMLTATGLTGPLTGNASTVTTNANLTGDVTSSGNATTIATDAVDIAMLSATGTASSSTFLRGDNSWAAAGSKISLLETVTLGSPNANVAKASMSYSTDDYAYFIIAFSGKAVTSEAAALEFRINNLSANYGYTVTQNYNGTLSGSAAAITTEIPLMSTSVHSGNSQPMNVIVTIQSSTVGNRYYNIVSDCWVASNTNDTEHVIGGQAGTASSTFSKFDFFLSTGNNFDTASEAVLYGVLR